MEEIVTRSNAEVERMILDDLNALDEPNQPPSYTTLLHAIGLEKITGLDFPIKWLESDPFELPSEPSQEYGVHFEGDYVWVVGGTHTTMNARVLTTWKGKAC